jgi:hypothetical protein
MPKQLKNTHKIIPVTFIEDEVDSDTPDRIKFQTISENCHGIHKRTQHIPENHATKYPSWFGSDEYAPSPKASDSESTTVDDLTDSDPKGIPIDCTRINMINSSYTNFRIFRNFGKYVLHVSTDLGCSVVRRFTVNLTKRKRAVQQVDVQSNSEDEDN